MPEPLDPSSYTLREKQRKLQAMKKRQRAMFRYRQLDRQGTGLLGLGLLGRQ
jgi:hypothetical protein